MSVIFNGTTHLDEAVAVVLRFFYSFQIKQRLVCLKLLGKKHDWRRTGIIIIIFIFTLSPSYGIESNRMVAAAAMRARPGQQP